MNEELTLLKERADQLGLTYRSNIGIESLRARVNAKLNDEADPEDDEPEIEQVKSAVVQAAPKPLTKAQQEQAIRERLQRECMKLVRVRIANLNPAKAQSRGEIITVANRFLGTVKKFVPFGEQTDNGYHIPQVIFDELKSRKFNSIKSMKDKNGAMKVTQRMVPEYSLEILPQLTQKELDSLARQQAASAGL